MNRIEVCFSPGEYHLYEQDFDLVVVLDVLRATSAICTAMEYGVGQIIPVATLEEEPKTAMAMGTILMIFSRDFDKF